MCCAAKVQTVSSVEELQKTTPIVLVRATKKVMEIMKVPRVHRNLGVDGGGAE